jgi:hypothetical protein
VARGDGHDEAFVDAMNIGLGPAVLGVEVIKHGKGSIALAARAGNAKDADARK